MRTTRWGRAPLARGKRSQRRCSKLFRKPILGKNYCPEIILLPQMDFRGLHVSVEQLQGVVPIVDEQQAPVAWRNRDPEQVAS